MSTLQHINSVVNYNWPEMSRRYPGFEKPQIVPAETLRGLAPVYLRSSIDQDPTSYFMFIAGDPTKGDCSREVACQFFDELFYEKLRMPSSYEANEGYSREEAIDKEVLPPATDRQFRSFYDEQMAKVNAEQERQRRIDNLGFDPDDGNTIDVDVDGNSSDARAVGQAQSTAVGMPKKIFYCVDFHCPVGGMLGYDGGRGGRLGGRRHPGGYLRESESPVSNILAAYKELPEGLKKDVEQIATGPDGAVVVKHKNGEFTMVEDGKVVMERVSADEVKKSGKLGQKQVTVMTKDELSKMLSERDDADPEQMMKEFVEKKRKCGVKEDEYRRPKNQPHNLHQVDEGEDIEEDEDVEEDEYRRPKNQPHNLHQVDEDEDVEEDEYRQPKNQPHNLHSIDESDAWVVDIDADGKDDVQFIVYASSEEDARKEAENEIKSHKLKNVKVKNIRPKDEKSKDDNDIEDAEDVFDEDESQFELNESMVRFCDRLIRG